MGRIYMNKSIELTIYGYKSRLAAVAHDSHRPREVWERECAEIGGFNPHTRNFTKICWVDEGFMSEHLDHVTAAVEAGIVKKYAFAEQLFASRRDFDEFLDYLLAYPLRIHDRWHLALASLAGCAASEESFENKGQLVDAIREASWWGPVAPVAGRRVR